MFDVLAHRPSTGCTTAPRSNSMNRYGGCPKSSVTKAPAGFDYISSTMPASGTFLDRFTALNCGNRRLSDREQIARSPLTDGGQGGKDHELAGLDRMAPGGADN